MLANVFTFVTLGTSDSLPASALEPERDSASMHGSSGAGLPYCETGLGGEKQGDDCGRIEGGGR